MSQPFDKNAKLRNELTFAAFHVLKGALAKHFSAFVTVGSKFESKEKGRIIVHYEGPAPSNDSLKTLEKLSNQIISENKPIEVLELNRQEAEAKYKDNLVNGQFIYEKRLPGEDIQNLTLIHIPDWTICCSPTKDICKSTIEIGEIQVLRFNHREQKKELEVCFQITKGKSSNEKAPGQNKNVPVQKNVVSRADDVNAMADELFQLFITQLQSVDPEYKLTEEKQNALKLKVHEKTTNRLNILKNTAYSTGISSKLV